MRCVEAGVVDVDDVSGGVDAAVGQGVGDVGTFTHHVAQRCRRTRLT